MSDRPTEQHDAGADVLSCPAPTLSGIQAVLADHWGIDAAAVDPLPSERDLNALINRRYVLKVSNPAEQHAVIDMETRALAHAARTAPDLPLPKTIPTLDGSPATEVIDDAGRTCQARLITVVPGRAAEGQPITATLAEEIGAVTARLSIALQGMFHRAADRVLDWDVRRAADVTEDLDASLLDLTESELTDLQRRFSTAGKATHALPAGLNHADVTLTNILVDGGHVSGVIDFGDMHHTAYVCDLAVTITSVIRNTATQQVATTWQLIRAVVTGYQRHRLLLPEEVDVLGDLIQARLALTLAISARRSTLHPENAAYITQHNASTLRVLSELRQLSPEELSARLHRIAGTAHAPRSGAVYDHQSSGKDELLPRRRTVMGGRLSPLFYAQPLELVRGEGPWLISADGTRYLDAYNNVAVLGHAHPAVVQAVTRQLAAINTHSRYLHHGIVDLAERLLATMPAQLDTCLFTTSGTEANDLAWRLATAYTGGTGAIVAEHAYHGSSKWLADLSPNEWPPGYHPAHVATFAAPRASTGGTDHATAVTRITHAAQALRADGDQPALVLADLGFTSEGVLDAPPDFLQGLIDGAHAEGALFVADEVQIGFGRIGPALWRFAAANLVPDIVTLGKPMAAGYPMGAVITRREIAERLAQDYEYFSTFAATPAAAAASLAVLETLHESGLPSQVVTVGDYLQTKLRELAATTPRLGEVRGRGLVIGVDTFGTSGAPEPEFAKALLNELVTHHTLAGLTGPSPSTVLKIRPPLIWTQWHADQFITALTASLAALDHRAPAAASNR